jgi:hypothetical protein
MTPFARGDPGCEGKTRPLPGTPLLRRRCDSSPLPAAARCRSAPAPTAAMRQCIDPRQVIGLRPSLLVGCPSWGCRCSPLSRSGNARHLSACPCQSAGRARTRFRIIRFQRLTQGRRESCGDVPICPVAFSDNGYGLLRPSPQKMKKKEALIYYVI